MPERRGEAAACWVEGQGRGRRLAGLRLGAMSPRSGRRAGAGVPRVRGFRQGRASRGELVSERLPGRLETSSRVTGAVSAYRLWPLVCVTGGCAGDNNSGD